MEIKSTRRIILAVIVILAVAVWSYNVTLFFPKSSPIKGVLTSTEIARKSEKNEVRPQTFLSSSFAYQAKYKDPFRAPFLRDERKLEKKTKPKTEESPPKYMLSGVLWNRRNPLAVISDSSGNSYTVKEGDNVGKVVIMKVSKDEVWYRFKNKIIKIGREAENK